jgi:hypothetical protein
MNYGRRLAALSVNTLVLSLLLAGCSDDDPADGQAGSGGSSQASGGDGSGGDSQPTGGVSTGQGGGGGNTQPTGGVSTGQGGGGGSIQPTGGVSTGQGGSGASVSGGGGGGAVSCTDAAPCGGDVVGTWNATESCVQVSGDLDVSNFGLGCSTVTVTGSLQVTGMLTANADGTYTDNTTTTGSEQLAVPASCLLVSGTTTTCSRISGPLASIGYTGVDCLDDAATGGCNCTATVEQTAGLGLVLGFPSTDGTYTTSGNMITLADDVTYAYCVSGTTLTMAPQSTEAPMSGSVVFQKQ